MIKSTSVFAAWILILSCHQPVRPWEVLRPLDIRYASAPPPVVIPAPIVILGSFSEDQALGPIINPAWNPRLSVRLHRLSITNEIQLRGAIDMKTIQVFYFGLEMPYDGPPILGSWRGPDRTRRIFFLQRDHGYLRLACDVKHDCTISVPTGFHLGHLVNASDNLEDKIAYLLMNPGLGREMSNFASDFAYGCSQLGTARCAKELARLASDKNPAIRQAACFDVAANIEVATDFMPRLNDLCRR